jgi:hypothetical protein
MTSRFCLSLLFIALFAFSAGAKSTVAGTAKEWAGLKARLIFETDPYSRTSIIAATSTISDSGDFELTVDIETPRRAWIAVNRFKAPIYLVPDSRIEIELVENPKNQLVVTWQNGSFDYVIVNPDSTDLNTQIAKFDQDYYNFFLKNAALLGTSSIKEPILNFEQEHGFNQDSFIDNYVKYSIAEMKLSNGFNLSDIFETYLDSSSIKPQNPAWVSLHSLFFADYFESYDKRFRGATLYNLLSEGISPEELDSLLSIDPYLADKNLRSLTAIHGISEVQTDGRYPKDALIEVLKYYQIQASDTVVREISANLKNKIEKNSSPQSILPFLSEKMRKSFKESDERGCVVMVTKPSNKSNKKETLLVENLVEKYDDVFRVMEISIEKEVEGNDWPSINIEDPYNVLTELGIYSFPHYLWVSPEGLILENPVERPSQGLEVRLYKIQQAAKKANEIKVGQ